MHQAEHVHEIQKIAGWCPQQVIFFENLTVIEHIFFFARVSTYLEILELSNYYMFWDRLKVSHIIWHNEKQNI